MNKDKFENVHLHTFRRFFWNVSTFVRFDHTAYISTAIKTSIVFDKILNYRTLITRRINRLSLLRASHQARTF